MVLKKLFVAILLSAILLIATSSKEVSAKPIEKRESINFGLTPTYDHSQPKLSTQEEQVLRKHNAIYLGTPINKKIYLTFDTGYEMGNTSKILDCLKKYNIKAVFFATGHFMEQEPDLIKRMAKEGHIVGNHTYYHPDMTKVSKERIINEISLIEDKYFSITNMHMMKIYRPPMGKYDEYSLNIMDTLGYKTLFWSLAYVDWEINKQRGWEYSYDKVISRIHPGAVILMHTVSTDNANALERIIVDLQNEGYNFNNPLNLISPLTY